MRQGAAGLRSRSARIGLSIGSCRDRNPQITQITQKAQSGFPIHCVPKMHPSDPHTLAIIFDWLGSLLMLGTVWGWLYGKISPRIKYRLKRSSGRLDALERYIDIRKKAAETGNFPALARAADHVAKLGYLKSKSSLKGAALLRRERLEHRRLEGLGLVSEDDAQRWKQWESDRGEISSLAWSYLWQKVVSRGRMIVVRVVDSITESLFRGKLAVFVFGLGFLLWNLAKFINLHLLK